MKHGLRRHRLYSIWSNMKTRCYNPQINHIHYKEKKIVVCNEWKNDFKKFYDWSISNGYSDELSIDRIDTNKNYEPNNCRWTTRTMQARNRTISKGKKYKGIKLDKRSNKYEARIIVDRKYIHLGTFDNEVDAAIAYNNYIITNDSGHSLNVI